MSVSEILIGGARVFYAPVATAVPADTVAYGGAWGGSWTELGYTSTPVVWAVKYDEYDVYVQQAIGPVKRVRTKEEQMFETTIAEFTAAHLDLVAEGTVSLTAAGASQPAVEELDAGGEAILSERVWGFEGLYHNGTTSFPVRLFIWKATATLNGNMEFAKEKEAGIPLQIKALQDLGQTAGRQFFRFFRVTAVATS